MEINSNDICNLKFFGIYSITNLLNNKKYIGSTGTSFLKRLLLHLSKLHHNKHPCQHLQAAWNLYGEWNFLFSIEEVLTNKSILLDREKFFIHKYNSVEEGYNENPIPLDSPMKNKSARQRSSITHKKQWKTLRESMTLEEYSSYIHDRYKFRYGIPPGNKGKKMSEEAISKMRKPKINGVSLAMREVHYKNAEITKNRADYILVFDINKKWINTFRCSSDLVEYSKLSECQLPIIMPKGKERFGKILNANKISKHATNGTPYKGLYLMRAPKSWKLSYANRENSWKAELPTMSQAESTLSEGAETTGEIKFS